MDWRDFVHDPHQLPQAKFLPHGAGRLMFQLGVTRRFVRVRLLLVRPSFQD
jgi:hypothetical protein